MYSVNSECLPHSLLPFLSHLDFFFWLEVSSVLAEAHLYLFQRQAAPRQVFVLLRVQAMVMVPLRGLSLLKPATIAFLLVAQSPCLTGRAAVTVVKESNSCYIINKGTMITTSIVLIEGKLAWNIRRAKAGVLACQQEIKCKIHKKSDFT